MIVPGSPSNSRAVYYHRREGMKRLVAVISTLLSFIAYTSGGGVCSGDETSQLHNKIVYTSELSGDQDIYTINPDGTGMVNITNNPPAARDPLGVDADPAWSPDGKKIAFMSTRTGEGEIWIMNADGSNPVNLTNDPTRWDLEPEWSPDGKQIVYISSEMGANGTVEGTAEIFVISVDGTNRVRLTNNDYTDAYPVFSPNGNMLVFHSEKGEIPIGECYHPIKGTTTKYANEIYVMDRSGNPVIQLTDTGDRSNNGISWSPDGAKLVYTSSKGCDPADIYIMEVGYLQHLDLNALAGKSAEELKSMAELGYLAIRRLTTEPGPDTNPSFSPDGTRIVFQSIRQGTVGGNDLFIMNADGSHVVQVTTTPALEKDPDWMGGAPNHLSVYINGNTSRTVTTTNPVTVEYAIRGGAGQEFFYALDAPALGVTWSYLNNAGAWVPFPEDVTQLTPFATAPADGDYLFYSGSVPAGHYLLCLGYDLQQNGHLDAESLVYDCVTATVP